MRVLQINANYGYGSTGIIMRDIGETLISDGYEAFFAYQRSNASIDHGYVIGNTFDWKSHALLCRILGGQGFYSKYATQKLCEHIDEILPNVVHLHNLHSNYIHLTKLLEHLTKRDIPTVITMHDCWLFTGKCFHYTDIGCKKYKNGCGDCPKQKSPPASYFFDRSAKDLLSKSIALHLIPRLTVVGCSKWIVSQSTESILKDLDVRQIYNGVDTEVFKPLDVMELKKQYHLKDEYVVLGMANKWCNPRNKLLIKSVSELPNTVLILVGCGERELQQMKVGYPNVITVGYISDRHQLALFYNMADVFVNLTFADTLPTVNMESICCGTPVITYDSCGSPELVDGDSGMVVPAGNHEKVIEAIKSARMMNWDNCRRSGVLRFDKQRCYKQYIEIYNSLSKER